MIKPFILRRTKSQVLTELPPKTEQLIPLEMGKSQRDFYETIRQYYQARILKLVDQQGVARSQLQILEALLRLRQACCDPRLIKPSENSGSVKLEEIVRICSELQAEGHKVLLFSQFTSMIKIIEKEFNRHKIVYQTLTGSKSRRAQTTDRTFSK
jgi:SNF2 family DNA or RNA helicase